MPIILVLLLSFVLAGCGGDSPAGPSTAVNFRLDANSCSRLFGTQTLNFAFFVDGVQVGNANLGIGITSPNYTIASGSHVASASVTNSTVRWTNLNFTVSRGSTFTYVLTC